MRSTRSGQEGQGGQGRREVRGEGSGPRVPAHPLADRALRSHRPGPLGPQVLRHVPAAHGGRGDGGPGARPGTWDVPGGVHRLPARPHRLRRLVLREPAHDPLRRRHGLPGSQELQPRAGGPEGRLGGQGPGPRRLGHHQPQPVLRRADSAGRLDGVPGRGATRRARRGDPLLPAGHRFAGRGSTVPPPGPRRGRGEGPTPPQPAQVRVLEDRQGPPPRPPVRQLRQRPGGHAPGPTDLPTATAKANDFRNIDGSSL